ncbi:hypothetical protein [Nitrospirillum sp. BR 11828]|uniref:hypothetical protein n=1 Tax=Nitrospirillum sp. BR 11828 TaxID=3104325 RepID=UPI002ACAF697|nr:hypothetical protein [Nitrospirillum sp. BR 11828]MDZ5647509.1 hypothetical protein [Nitrospirillum sp. BR 11828]
MDIEIKFQDIRPSSLVEMAGVDENFYVGNAGSRPDLGSCYFYGDKNDQFFFYLKSDALDSGHYNVNIYAASMNRLAGPFFSMTHLQDKKFKSIKSNIIKFFSTIDFFYPLSGAPPNIRQKEVVFTWGGELFGESRR